MNNMESLKFQKKKLFSKVRSFPTLFWRAEGPHGPLENSKSLVKIKNWEKPDHDHDPGGDSN